MVLTGIRDIDFEILLKLSDYELGLVCQTNKKINTLCEDSNFWIKKLLSNFPLDISKLNRIKKYLEFENYKDLYIFISDFEVSVSVRFFSFIEDGLHEEKLEKFKKLEKLVFPEYIDKNKFIKFIKRKIFGILYKKNGKIYFDENSIEEEIAYRIRIILKELEL